MMQQNALVLASGRGVAESRRVTLYRRARVKARLGKLLARLSGHSSRLLHLGAFLRGQRLLSSYYAGLQAVRLDRIRGSEGRCEDFDRSFRPLSVHSRERWMRVALAYLRNISLPPVDLVQVGDIYFVRDGHHRVSVARIFGQASIDAQVTVWALADAPASLARHSDALLGAA